MKFNLKYIKETIQRKLERLDKGTLTGVQKIIVRNELEHDLELIENCEKELRQMIPHEASEWYQPYKQLIMEILGKTLNEPSSVEVMCFGVPRDRVRFVKGVQIFNEKLRVWETYDLVEYYDNCPVCGKRMHVYAVKGTTWLACCSDECYQKLQKKREELGSLSAAFEYFKGQR